MNNKIVLHDLCSGKDYDIMLPCVIGRGSRADLSFPDNTISQRHALLTVTDDKNLWIEDLKSSNGVFVNDVKIKERAVLKPGDSIQLGMSTFQISESPEDITQQTVILHTLGPAEEKALDSDRLKMIYDITGELASNRDVGKLGENIFSRFREIFRQDRGYIASFGEDGSLKPLCLFSMDESVPLSKSIINRLLRSGESFILEDALSDAAFKEQESIMALRVRSALCVPLIYNNQIYGLIYLDRNVPGAYRQEDLEFLRTIGSILAPLIENARLWSELKKRFTSTVDTLRETEARLIETERTAAYVRLAHAMAHEIRNPMMVIGGRLRRLLKLETEDALRDKIVDIMTSVERIETVLHEVDTFVKIPPPQKLLQRIDRLIHEEIDNHNSEWESKSIRPALSVDTPHVMVPLDAALFRKSVSMIINELLFTLPQDSSLNIIIGDCGNEVCINFGSVDRHARLSDPFDKELRDKPWSTSLFLNMAHKILKDHGGRLLLDPQAVSAFPIVMRVPMTEKI